MPADTGRLERLLRRDRLVVLCGLATVTLLAWGYLFHMARGMVGLAEGRAPAMASGLVMPQVQRWGSVELLLLFVMWAVMMVAMMMPSAAPLLLTFARARRRKGRAGVVGYTGILLLGYVLVWVVFSVLATLAQWALHRAALLSPMMVSASPVLGGVLLFAAGAFQLTPLKRACLVRCRSPMSFLMSEWRPGRGGTLVLGLKHGAHCVGCCWMLMGLLFVAGVMNLLWVAAIAAFVLLEKVGPTGELIGRVSGFALMVAGIVLVVGSAAP